MADVLLIDCTNFQDYPPGGLLSFSKQMMRAFGNRLALVGIATDDSPIGKWINATYSGVRYDRFNYCHWSATTGKPFVPRRLSVYFHLRRYRKEILSRGIKAAFIQSPESLLALGRCEWNNLCYIFHGAANPLRAPRYKWGRVLSGPFERLHFSALDKADLILACAGRSAIDDLIERSRGTLSRERVVQFPTRVDTNFFKPIPRDEARRLLAIPDDRFPVLVSCGRVSRVKGWRLVLDAFVILQKKFPKSHLYFVGDGEDRPFLEKRIAGEDLRSKVTVTGFQSPERVALFLNASDVCVIGSGVEGWSIALLEALACGKRIVSTDVSGARETVEEGKNGWIVRERNPIIFAEAVVRALDLDNAECTSLRIAERYALDNLARDIGALWEPLA